MQPVVYQVDKLALSTSCMQECLQMPQQQQRHSIAAWCGRWQHAFMSLTGLVGVAMAAATSDDSAPSAAPLLPLLLPLLLLLPCCALRCVHVGYRSWSRRLPSTIYGRCGKNSTLPLPPSLFTPADRQALQRLKTPSQRPDEHNHKPDINSSHAVSLLTRLMQDLVL
jgi:hypothetical protein